MDIECAKLPPIPQATDDDLQAVFAADFGSTVTLVRNYGDRLEANATDNDQFHLAYYDAVSGRRHEAETPLSFEQLKDAFVDYFQGNWNWHRSHVWRTM